MPVNRDQANRAVPREPSARELQALRTLCSQGRHTEAVALAQEITLRFPQSALGWKALGETLMRMGQGAAALAAMRKAADLSPTDFDAHYQLGLSSQALGRLADAEFSFRQALQIRPKHADGHNSLGCLMFGLGRPVDAEACFRRASQIRPKHAETHNNLGNTLVVLGRLGDAEACFRRALQLRPHFPEAHNNLGSSYRARGLLAEARVSFERALRLRPDYAEGHSNLGEVCLAMGLLAEAETSFRAALRLKPDLSGVHNNLGTVQLVQGNLGEARASFQQAVQRSPRYATAHNNLGNVHLALGQVADAGASYRMALQIQPDFPEAHSNLLLSLAYGDDVPNDAVLDAHRQYGARVGTPYEGRWPDHSSQVSSGGADRRLRVGYVSPDLREHSVAYFIAPLLRQHDRDAVEIFCYANVARPDAVTESLQQHSAHWLSTVGMTDASLAERIVADRIDILVDLAGHTAGNRLPVFARKPAPLQISWLGYPNTTGLHAIDYRLIDAITDPPGEADSFAIETLLRLEHGFLCYEPANNAPDPLEPPCVATGTITFGSFNNPAKLSAGTLDAWVRILATVPHSRLLLKGRGFGDELARRQFIARFAKQGGDPQSVVLLGQTERTSDHLAVYQEMDIALDTFPYNGTTTTCEALWMGVPVVTVAGDRHAGRVGASLLTQVGLTELIATSMQRYVEIASALAADVARLRALRATMRERMAASSLCDAKAFARKIEAAYSDLWKRAAGEPVDSAAPKRMTNVIHSPH